MQGVSPGGVRDIRTLPDSFPQWEEEQPAKTEWLGVVDHQYMQDKVGRGGYVRMLKGELKGNVTRGE